MHKGDIKRGYLRKGGSVGSYPCHECARLLHAPPSPSPAAPSRPCAKEVNAVGCHFAIRSDAIQMRPTRVRIDAAARFIYRAMFLSSTPMSMCAGWCQWSRQRLNDTWQEHPEGGGKGSSPRLHSRLDKVYRENANGYARYYLYRSDTDRQ